MGDVNEEMQPRVRRLVFDNGAASLTSSVTVTSAGSIRSAYAVESLILKCSQNMAITCGSGMA
jgi:hypothetical protein